MSGAIGSSIFSFYVSVLNSWFYLCSLTGFLSLAPTYLWWMEDSHRQKIHLLIQPRLPRHYSGGSRSWNCPRCYLLYQLNFYASWFSLDKASLEKEIFLSHVGYRHQFLVSLCSEQDRHTFSTQWLISYLRKMYFISTTFMLCIV